MKKIITLMIMVLGFQFGYSQLTVNCPPCLPVSGCNQCFATQSEADACSSRRLIHGAIVDAEGVASQSGFAILTNPITNGELRIANNNEVRGLVYIYSQSGSIVQEIVLDGSLTVTSPVSLSTGVYHLIAIDNDGNSIGKKKIIVAIN